MKRILLAIVLCTFAAKANAANILTITEVSGTGFNAISADYNGAPVPIDLTGAVEGWTIELPGSFALASLGEVIVAEADGSGLVNSVLVGTSPTFLTWTGDQAAPPGGPFSTSVTLPGAGLSGNEEFDLVLREILPTATPDAGATGAFLLLSFGMIASARKFFASRY